MRSLTEDQFRAEAEPALRQVFSSDNPFDQQPFTPNIPVRRVVFGLEYDLKYIIRPPLIDAVVAAASSIGDTGCYFTALLRMNQEADGEFNHWYIPFSEISVYKKGDYKVFRSAFNWENVLYSPQGKWGIMTSHESHGLLGGTQKFMDEVRRQIPNLDDQVYPFLKLWQHHKTHNKGAKTDWLLGLLTQIYGDESASQMLREVGLP